MGRFKTQTPDALLILKEWEFHDFSVNQILREINFVESRRYKTAVLAISGALKIIDLVNFSLQKMQKFIEITIQSL